MKEQIIFDLLDADSIIVEVNRPSQMGGPVQAPCSRKVILRLSKRFEDTL